MDSHQINVAFEKDMVFTATIDEYSIVLDTTSELTSHAGPSPKKLMLTSLAGCTGMDVVSILNKMRVNFSQFSIAVSGDLTAEHPVIYSAVEIIYSIKIDDSDQKNMEKAVALSKEKYCGVSAMFSKFSTIKTTIHYL